MESSVQQTINDMKAEFEQRELHIQKKVESDVQAHAHTISIKRNRIAAQTKEMAEQKALITENNEKQRSMYNDLQAVRIEMHENQNLKEGRIRCNAVPRSSPARERRGSQGPMLEAEEPWVELSRGKRRRKDRGDQFGRPWPSAAGEVQAFMRRDGKWRKHESTSKNAWADCLGSKNAAPDREHEAGFRP